SPSPSTDGCGGPADAAGATGGRGRAAPSSSSGGNVRVQTTRAMMAAGAALALASALPSAAPAETIAEKAQVCGACHGPDGNPGDKNIPVIAGQHQGYLYLQLRDFKRGTRANEQMQAVVEPMERDDMLAIAEYFSKLPWPDL